MAKLWAGTTQHAPLQAAWREEGFVNGAELEDLQTPKTKQQAPQE